MNWRSAARKHGALREGGPAAGTSGRSAGVICRYELGPIYVRLTLVGFQRIAEFRREHGFTFNPWGGLRVVWEPGEWPYDDSGHGAVCHRLPGPLQYARCSTVTSLLARFPWIKPEGVRGGVFEPNTGFIDPYELIALYRRLLDAMPNVELSYDNPVLQVRRQGDRVTELATRKGLWQVGAGAQRWRPLGREAGGAGRDTRSRSPRSGCRSAWPPPTTTATTRRR